MTGLSWAAKGTVDSSENIASSVGDVGRISLWLIDTPHRQVSSVVLVADLKERIATDSPLSTRNGA